MSSIGAEVICDSISPQGHRLTTVEVNCHRFIWPEVLTHRAFSRNSQSSRACPTAKLIEQVRTNPAFPAVWGKNKPGMQAGDDLNPSEARTADLIWEEAAYRACDTAEKLSAMGVSKQLVNRTLEPYLMHRAIITSTEAGWSNFFDQRVSPLAQPEIRLLATSIQSVMNSSTPQPTGYGDWHLPYVTDDEWTDDNLSFGTLRKISAARCARVSYLTHDGKRDIEKDLDLYNKLVTADPPHWSPLEHVATPTGTGTGEVTTGNFERWSQLRHLKSYQ
jgi:thymidylate synthase ThyX